MIRIENKDNGNFLCSSAGDSIYNLTVTVILILIIVGITFGVGSGVTGISAVNLILPMLIIPPFLFSYYNALGTSLFIDMINSGVVALFYSRHKNVDFRIGLLMGLISFTFAVLGAIIAFSIGQQLLLSSFGLLQIILGAVFIWRGVRQTEELEEEGGELSRKDRLARWFNRKRARYQRLTLIIASAILGLFGGLLGAGGGFIITFLLIFLLGFESHKAVGTACFIMLFTTAGGALYYSLQGAIDFSLGGILGPISLLGAFVGTQIAHKLSEKHLTVVLGIIIVVFGFVVIFYN